MGTNFYARIKPCNECGLSKEEIHIGKSSYGWTFTFHATDEIKSYKDWLIFLEDSHVLIFDECGDKISLEDFKEMVEKKKDEKMNHAIYCKEDKYDHSYLDEERNSMSPGEFS